MNPCRLVLAITLLFALALAQQTLTGVASVRLGPAAVLFALSVEAEMGGLGGSLHISPHLFPLMRPQPSNSKPARLLGKLCPERPCHPQSGA